MKELRTVDMILKVDIYMYDRLTTCQFCLLDYVELYYGISPIWLSEVT